MNLARPPQEAVSHVLRSWLTLRRLFPKRKCQTFGVQHVGKGHRIEKVYVINLEREPGRWSKMEQELRHILDSSGAELLSLTERHVAVDANAFSEEPPKDADIDPFYTLGDQLFVEPQPLVFPTRLELNAPIRMSRAEVAVARSHISVWRQVSASNHAYVMILEDDAWFHSGFARCLDRVWDEVVAEYDNNKRRFDVLYVSYLEAKHGAPKALLSNNLFRPVRGLWHLSGYVLSREGAAKLLQLLPCRGPIDLWINHQFEALDVLATKQSLVSQRRDAKSTNSYSILPTLTTIGAITSERASLFNIRPNEQPVFAFGPEGSGHSSLAMALCMLGYRCCSDLQLLPAPELERLLEGRGGRVFNAYVNIGSIGTLMGLDIRVPDYSTLSRRANGLSIAQAVRQAGSVPVHLVVDSTGLKIFGEGEWLAQKHKTKGIRRRWRKLHLGLDLASGAIVCAKLTHDDVGDRTALPGLLDQLDAPVTGFLADGAYDGASTRDLLRERYGETLDVVIPPPKNAVTRPQSARDPTVRDRHIAQIRSNGRMAWQVATGYNQRSRIETQVGRWKGVVGPKLKSRSFSRQITEIKVGQKVLNTMTALGRPVFERIA